MLSSIRIKDENVKSRLHFKSAKFEKINILFGGNGSGKSTLLQYIEESLEEGSANIKRDSTKKHLVHKYYNSKHNDRLNNPNGFSSSGKDYGTALLQKVEALEVSEGQSIMYSFTLWLQGVQKLITNDTEHVILIDEIDSGLSCDHVNVMLHILNDCFFSKSNVQVFIASNAFHWVYVMKKVFSMYTGTMIRINSYEEFFKIQMDKQVEVGTKSDFNFIH